MEEGYAYCSNKWTLDKSIKNELRLLLIISSLCAQEGYCFASNKYLGNIFDESEENISRKLQKLKSKGYIDIEYDKRGSEIISRKVRLIKKSTDHCQKYQSTIDKNVKDKNISIKNNKEIYKESFGTYKRIKLTQEEYLKLVDEFGEDFIKQQIELLDEYIESNNNKNKYTNFNLVLRKSIRENWFTKKKVGNYETI